MARISFSREVVTVNASLASKHERLIRMNAERESLASACVALAHEIEVDAEELASLDPKIIWRRAYGTPLTYQALCDFFRAASPKGAEAAARLLFNLATAERHQYAFWALRFWPYWNSGERTALVLIITASTDSLAGVSASKAAVLDEVWGRTTYHFGRCPSRSLLLLSLKMKNDEVSLLWLRTIQPWLEVPLSPSQLRKIS
jgi:hypothetical protein